MLTESADPRSVFVLDVEAAASGDRDAFTRLVTAHASLVCSIVFAVVRDVEASEEVAQEVFLQAWRGIGQLRDPKSFRGWLRQLARNRAADHLRGHIRRRDLLKAAAREVAPEPVGPDEALLAEERDQAVSDALEELPDDAREVLVLFYREGQSVRQVAGLLELREVTVRKRLSRARSALRTGVLARLGDHLADTAPGAAFVLGVASAIAAAAPSTAVAGTGALVGSKAVATGLALGTGLGLLAVFVGYEGARKGARTEVERRQLLTLAITSATAVVISGLAFAFVGGVIGTAAAMTVLLSTLWINQLVWLPRILAPRLAAEVAEDPVEAPRRHRRQSRAGFVGLLVGSLAGLSGAVGGLVASGQLP